MDREERKWWGSQQWLLPPLPVWKLPQTSLVHSPRRWSIPRGNFELYCEEWLSVLIVRPIVSGFPLPEWLIQLERGPDLSVELQVLHTLSEALSGAHDGAWAKRKGTAQAYLVDPFPSLHGHLVKRLHTERSILAVEAENQKESLLVGQLRMCSWYWRVRQIPTSLHIPKEP